MDLGRAARRALPLLVAAACLVAGSARAEDARLRELDAALAGLESAGSPSGDGAALAPLLADLERKDAAQRAQFAAAGAKRLGPKAADRLTRARAAYDAGHGRLLQILRALSASTNAPPAEGAGEARVLALREAREIVGRIAKASEAEPISARGLSVVAPVFRALPLGQAGGVDAAGRPIDAVPETLKAAAATLDGPVAVYEWVRNQIRPDFYYGVLKGPEQAYLEQSANDADTASVLVMLFRAKGVPARYVRGTVEVPAATLQSMTGTASIEQAVRVLERAGIPHEVVLGASAVSAVRMERVWAEAYLPYANYRGTSLDTQGKVWVPLDPGFKQIGPPTGLDVVGTLGLDAREVLDSYLSAPHEATPLEFVRQRVTTLLGTQKPGTSYSDFLDNRDPFVETLGLLPSSLPYKVTAPPEVGFDLPDSLRHTVRIVGQTDTTILDVTLPTADLLGHRLTLSYVPATEEDEAVVRSYGGLTHTPPYLVEVRPEIKSGGVAVAIGSGAVGLGVRYTLRLELRSPGGTQTVTNTAIAGNLTAIGLGGRAVTGTEVAHDQAAEILARLAWSYLDRWNQSDSELSSLLRVVPVRPSVSACLVMSDIQVDYAGGDPLYPLSFVWRGLAIDADHRATAPVGVEGVAEEKSFLLLSGLEGSVLEHRIFEDEVGVVSLSTAKGLGLAPTQGIDVVDVNGANVDAVLDTLPFDLAVKEDIRQATARGLLARVPTAPVRLLTWHGAAYLLLDEETGEAAYQLQGGRSGGVTAPDVIDFPTQLRDALELQGETPAPETTLVARIQKFGTTDFQEGTVDVALGKAFKVLVTDADGFPVPKARVTFTVMGGGGQLLDPLTSRRSPADLDVLSDKRGEAQATLVLGALTSAIPRFIQLEGDENATQVGLNLVTARSGIASLPEPFTSLGLPDDRFDGQLRHATVYSLNDAFTDGLFNLKVAGRLGVRVTDQHGNPLSNWPYTFAFRPPAVQGTPPSGWSLADPATTTPGVVLKPADYTECLKKFVNPGWGDCAGQSASVVVNSSALGAFAYAVVGDSTYSSYIFDIGSDSKPRAFSVSFGTWGYLCHSPNIADCPLTQRPDIYVAAGSRPVRVNRFGNPIEAYPVGGDAQAVFWADVVYEKERIDKTTDAQGKDHYHAFGTNQWVRQRLTNSILDVLPVTAGTVATAATHIGQGNYASVMTMAGEPQLNTVSADAKHYPPDIPYVPWRADDPSTVNEVDPAYVDPIALTVRRVADPNRPWRGPIAFSLWGVDAALGEVKPSPLLLDPGGAVARAATVPLSIRPEAFRQLLEPSQVLFELKASDATVLTATGSGADAFAIPAGLPLASGVYDAQLSVRGLTSSGGSVVSSVRSVPTCRLLDLEKQEVELLFTRDPVNGTACGEGGALVFDVCQDALVDLTVGGVTVTGSVDGATALAPVEALPLARGRHTVRLSPDTIGVNLDKRTDFELTAVDAADATLRESATGTLVDEERNRSVLPVGHTFVKGVDLLDGHVVQQSTDLKLPGRHLGLEVTRTYSSAGQGAAGVMGAGWSFNYASELAAGTCGLVTVRTADGSSQVFRTGDGGNTFAPQKGYHTRLRKNADGSYDFTDKSGTRHHFREPADPTQPNTPRRLEYIEEPHGDRVVMTYDVDGRVTKVSEVQGGTEVRSLVVTYTKAFGLDRIATVTAPGLGLEVAYRYDAFGNLLAATRSGANVSGPAAAAWTKAYEYRTSVVRDPHQLVAAVDPNGSRTEYAYYAKDDPFPGEGVGVVLPGNSKEEYAKEVREFPAAGITLSTRFSYDYTDAVTLKQFATTVRDARGNDTRYVMNPGGSPLRIEEPLGKVTAMVWSDSDIFKTRETNPLGRVTDYGYDDRGNLTSERITTADRGVVETQYAYHPSFNKLTFKQDAEARVTRYEIDPATSDLRSMTDAVGNVTSYEYDGAGQLVSVTDPRGHATSHADHDSFGNARTITDPLGNVTTREYDPRGRLAHETDTLGHDVATAFDGLDRPITVTRLAGGSSDPEVTSTEYFPGGEPRAITNAVGGRTVFTLDGLNRVVRTSVVVGGQTLVTQAEYDADGNKTSETDRRGVARRMTYDALNRLVRTEIVAGLTGEGPTGTIAESTYDAVGNKLTDTDLAGLVTRFVYDGLYRVTQKVLPESSSPGHPYTEGYDYDRVGNRIAVTDANGHTSRFAYDGLNRLVRTEDALGHVTTVTFADPEGSKVNKSEEHDTTRGVRTTFAYDFLNREVEHRVFLEGAGSAGEVYVTGTTYDDPAHAMTVTDARGTRTRTALDGLDHPMETVVDADGLALTTRVSYDGLGNKKVVTDPRQLSTRYAYDELGRVLRVTDALSHDTSFEYDGGGLKTAQTDRRGVRSTFTFDNIGRPRLSVLVPSISTVPSTQEVRYDDRGRKRTQIDARSHASVFDLDGLDRVVRMTDARGAFGFTKWDGVNKREETDKRGHTTRLDYDELNRVVRVTDPAPFDAQTVETTYLDVANRVSVKDRRGIVKTTQMDPLGRVLTVARAGVVLETNAYDALGNKTSSRDAEMKETRFGFDAANRLSSRTDGFGSAEAAVTTYAYDENGNRTEERDARAAALGLPWSTRNTYDALNRLDSITDGESHVMRHGFDEEGNRTSVVEPELQETAFAYDEEGKLLTVTQPGALVTSYAYDANRNRIRQTDAAGHVVEMAYDELDRLSSFVQDPSGFAFRTAHAYDPDGNETLLTDPKGQTVTSTYDELNRLKTKTYAFAADDPVRPWRHTTSIAYAYDPNSNLTGIDESMASGSDPPSVLSTARVYDDLDRLTSETSPLPDGGSRTVGYTYFANGTRKTITGPATETTSYTYDGQNRLATATTAGGATSYAYFPDDLLHVVTYPNGVTSTHAYDKADRLVSLVNARGASTLSSYVYAYDGNGNRLSQVETNGGPAETTTYTYDPLNRLATITYPVDLTFPLGRVVTYGFDAVGNRTRETEKTPAGVVLADKQGVFDNLNRLTSLTDLVDGSKTAAYTWDANGNQRTRAVGGVTTEYRYDCRDKLVEVVEGASTPGRFQYDFEGRRSKKIGADGIVQYVYDQTSVLAEFDSSGLEVAKYDYGSDRLISMVRSGGVGAEGRRWYSLDGVRSVVGLTDDSGALVASYHLDTWGNFRFPSEVSASRNHFAFTGYEWDPELGLFNAKARYFDPQIGRFLSQDSFLGQIDDPPSLHRYFYANDNPTRFIDTTGHAGIDTVKNAGRAVLDFGAGAIVAYTADVIPGLDRYRPDPYSRASAAGQRVGDVAALVQSSYEIAAGISAIAGGAGGEGLLAVTPGTQAIAVGAAPVAGALIAGGALAVGHGGYTAMTANKHLDRASRSESDSVARVRKESPSGGDAAPQPGQKAETGSVPTLEPATEPAPAKPRDALVIERKIPRDKLKYRPPERGRAPIGSDDKPIELHHADQSLGNDSPRVEMTRTEHRGHGNFKANHPNTGQKPSRVDRAEAREQHTAHWESAWDAGEFEHLPRQPESTVTSGNRTPTPKPTPLPPGEN